MELIPDSEELITKYIEDLGKTEQELLNRYRRKNGKEFYIQVARILNSYDR